jgi:hypothetical protein
LKQAGAELCQAQAQVGLPAEADLINFSQKKGVVFVEYEIIFHLT